MIPDRGLLQALIALALGATMFSIVSGPGNGGGDPGAAGPSEPSASSLQAPSAAPAASPVTSRTAAEADRVTRDASVRDASDLLADFLQLDRATLGPSDAAVQATLRAELTRLRTGIHFLVSTVPDAYDSEAGWLFDSTFQGLRRGVEQAGFTLDRFYLPDWDPRQSGAAALAGRLHEQYPALVLFKQKGQLLLLYLVPETPVAGIHAAPFLHAVDFINAWCTAPVNAATAPGCGPALDIIGPSFSGSAMSLGTVVARARASGHSRTFRFWSGAATGQINRTELNRPGLAEFRSAAVPDIVTLRILRDVLVHEFGLPPHGLVRLAETTVYGRGVRGGGGTSIDTYSFPLHLSRLRANPEGATSRVPAGMAPIRPVKLDEAVGYTDFFPMLRKDMTESSVQLMVRQQLSDIHRQRRRAIGIFASDVRDRLYLAQEIRYHAPDSLLFTSESNLLYAHPSFLPFMRGMLVASTYPLSPWAQRLGGAREGQPFSASSSQGAFNATSHALSQMGLGDGAMQLLDYGPPLPRPECGPSDQRRAPSDCRESYPVLWLSIVGRNELWPLRAIAVDAQRDARDFLFAHPARPTPFTESGIGLRPSHPAMAFFLLVAAATIIHGYVAWRPAGRSRALQRLRAMSRLRDGAAGPVLWPEAARSFAVCVGALLVAYGLGLALAWAMVIERGDGRALAMALWGAGLGIWLAALGGVLHLAWRVVRQVRRTRVEEQDAALISGPTAVVSQASRSGRYATRSAVFILRASIVVGWFVSAVMFAWWMAAVFPPRARADFDAITYVLLFDRATHVMNGVNPIVVIVCFLAGFYLVGAFGLRLTTVRRNATFIWEIAQRLRRAPSAEATPQDARAERVRRDDDVVRTVQAKVASVSRWTAAVGLSTLVAGLSVMAVRRPLTVEGWRFDWGYAVAYVVLQTIIISTLGKVLVEWLHIRGALDGLVDRRDILDAFARLPEGLRNPARLIRRPRLLEVREFAERAERIHASTEGTETESRALAGEWLRHIAAEREASPRAPWATSRSKVLMRRITREMAARLTNGPTPDVDDAYVRRWEEECVAMQLLFSLRAELSHLAQMAVLAMVLIFVLISTHTVYPVHPRQVLHAIAWMDLSAAVIVGVWGLLSLDRNGVLSAMTSTKPYAVNWNWTLGLRLALYAVVPLLSALAVQFPEVGGSLLQWFEPVRRALP